MQDYGLASFRIVEMEGVKFKVMDSGTTYRISRRGYLVLLQGSKVGPLQHRQVGLGHTGSKAKIYLHRIVAKAWLPDYSEELQVDHIDRNPSNNHPSNLRMVTQSQNSLNRDAKRVYNVGCGQRPWVVIVAGKNHGSYSTEEEATKIATKVVKEIFDAG